jgi:hypothetical protein
MVPTYLSLPKGKAWIYGCGRYKACKKEKKRKTNNKATLIGKSSQGIFMAQVTSVLTVVVLANQLNKKVIFLSKPPLKSGGFFFQIDSKPFNSHLLRLASAVCVPLALFTVVTTARRPDPYERYAWGIFSLGLLTLTWLLNAYLNQNSRLLAFVYPLFYGWVALAGPAYYYSLVGRRPQNLSITLLHLTPAILVFTSGFIGVVKGPLTHDQLELLFMSSERISALAWSMLGDTTLQVVAFTGSLWSLRSFCRLGHQRQETDCIDYSLVCNDLRFHGAIS